MNTLSTENTTLLLGDCLKILPELPKHSVDFICVDPPFNTTSMQWDKMLPFADMWQCIKHVLKPEGCCAIFGSQPFTSALVMSNPQMFKYELIWNKNKCGSPGLAKFRPMKTHENILLFAEGKTLYNPQMEVGEAYSRKAPKSTRCNNHGYGFKNTSGITNTGTRYPKSILNISRDFSAQQQVHPTQKPVPLLEWLILTYSNEGDTVLDFTMGSGSTGVAAVNTGRSFIGIEQDASYFAICEKRIGEAKLLLT